MAKPLLVATALGLILVVLAASAPQIHPKLDGVRIAIEDIKVESDHQRGFSQIRGRITNNDRWPRKLALKMLFYSQDGGVIGRAGGTIQDLGPGQTRTFRLFTITDIDGYSRYSLEVEEASQS